MTSIIDEQVNTIPLLADDTDIETRMVEDLDALSIDMEDSDLAEIIRRRVKRAEAYWESEVHLRDRQKKITDYLYGEQVNKNELHHSQKQYMENVMWEGWTRNRSILMSRIPDVDVIASDTQDELSLKTANDLEMLINTEVKSTKNKKTLAKSVMAREINLYGVIKARWNNEKNDYEFLSVNPKNIILDHTATDSDNRKFVCEIVKTTIEDVLRMFPNKSSEFIKAYKAKNGIAEDKDIPDNKLASPMYIWEVWFEEWVKKGDKHEKIIGAVWQYGDFILEKMKHPYWDWTGEDELVNLKVNQDREMSEDDIYDMMFDTSSDTKLVYNNFLDKPEFPYHIITLNESDENSVDMTTSFEQILLFQDNINREGIQISTMNNRSYGKDVYSVEAFKDEAALEELDPRDIDQVIKVQGEDIGKVYQHIDYPMAPAQLYESKRENRSIAFEMLALNATTRGVRESGDETLGARQMMREQDFGVLDYEVDMTLNASVLWMSRWTFQFVRLFYKQKHFKDVLGEDGSTTREAFTKDMVGDGHIIRVSASSVNKQRKYQQAVADAQSGMSDPLSYFEDTEQDNPKERAKRLLMFQMAPQMYMQQYLGDVDQGVMQNMAAQLAPPQGAPQPEQMPPGQPGQSTPQPAGAPPMGGGGGTDDPLGLFR